MFARRSLSYLKLIVVTVFVCLSMFLLLDQPFKRNLSNNAPLALLPEEILIVNDTGIEKNKVGIGHLTNGSLVVDPGYVTITGHRRPDKGFLTIGVPTVYRSRNGMTYLKATLKSLFKEISQSDKHIVVIVVYLADFHINHRQLIKDYLVREYRDYLEWGFLQILEVDKRSYPVLNNLRRNYGDDPVRVSWRAKQVCDYAFMMYASRNISQYYMQLEDDVLAATDFVTHVRQFIKQKGEKWATLQFSTLGYIGKLYRSSDLEGLARFMLLFYDQQPVDWLFKYYAIILTYPKMYLRKPTLFQHIGDHSSLILKNSQAKNKLKDKYFSVNADDVSKTKSMSSEEPDNPAADICTSMKQYKQHTPQLAYTTLNDKYFWGQSPRKDDTLTTVFVEPVKLDRVSVDTGYVSSKNDYLRHGVLELSPALQPGTTPDECKCEAYVPVANVEEGYLFYDNSNGTISFPVKCLRIRLTQNQDEWLILHQIFVWMKN